MRRVITLTIATVLIYSSLLPSNASEIDEVNTAVDSEVQLLDPSVEPQLSSEELTSESLEVAEPIVDSEDQVQSPLPEAQPSPEVEPSPEVQIPEPLDSTNEQDLEGLIVNTEGDRIVGGVVTPISEVPWQVALLRNNGTDDFTALFCGGSIISERWILTAAHCVPNMQPSGLKVLTGQSRLSRSAVSAGFSVSRIIIHPDYNASTWRSDIALLELSTPIPFDSTRRAIALPEGAMPSEGTSVKISGYGRIQFGGSRPDSLLSAQVSLVSDQTCLQRYSNFIDQVMFCAGHPNFETDSCQGDSGGPLAVFDAQTGWRILGVTSFGRGCAEYFYPGVYAKVQYFKDWIQGYLPPPPVIAPPPPPPAPPVISSTSMVGKASSNSRLTIRSSISGKPTTVSYSWFRCQVPPASISDIIGNCVDTGSNKESILVDGANVGSYLVGRVTATNLGGTTEAFTNFTGLILPGISGAAVPNKRLTFVLTGPLSWNSSFSYQWIRNGTPIPGQTGQSYSVTKGDNGKSIAIQVTVSREGYTVSLQSSDLKVGKQLPKPKFSSTGKTLFNETLKSSVTFGSLKPKLSYQWFRDGTPISRATKSSYRLAVADVGKKVHVVVSAKLNGYATQEFKGKTSRTVSPATFTKTPPRITGTFGIGRTLSAAIGSVGASKTKKEYQWLRAGKTIEGATKSKYKLTRADAGKKISVRVKVTKPGYKTMSVTSPRLDSWVRTTITKTYWANSLPCEPIGNSFDPCDPDFFSDSGRGVRLWSHGDAEMIVASSVPTTGAVQRWRLTFGQLSTDGDKFYWFPSSQNPSDESSWTSGNSFVWGSVFNRSNLTTDWTKNVGSANRVHYVITSFATFGSMRYETITIEYETIR
jgi:trypsin